MKKAKNNSVKDILPRSTDKANREMSMKDEYNDTTKFKKDKK